MKKKLFLSLFLITVFSVMGFSFEKGTKSIGGSISFESFKFDDYDSNYRFSLSPSFSYFLNDRFCLEVSPGFSIAWRKDMDNYYSYSLGFGGRYYYKLFYGAIHYDFAKAGTSGDMGRTSFMDFRLGKMVKLVTHIYLDFFVDYRIGLGKIYYTKDVSFDNDRREFSIGVGFAYFFK